jgi:hypothetical protein
MRRPLSRKKRKQTSGNSQNLNRTEREKVSSMKNKPYYKEYDASALQHVHSSWEAFQTTPDDATIDAMRQDNVRSIYLSKHVAQERAIYFANKELFDIIDTLL